MQFLIDDGVCLVDGMKQYSDADVFIIGDTRCEHDEALFPRLEHPGFTLDEAKVWFKEQRQAFEQTGVDLYAMQCNHRAAWQEKLDNEEDERERLAEEEEEREREAEEIAELDRVEKELAEKKRAETAAKQLSVWRDVCIRQEQERARMALLLAARGRAEDGVGKRIRPERAGARRPPMKDTAFWHAVACVCSGVSHIA